MFAGYAKLYKLQGGSFQAVSPNFLAKIDRLELDPLDTDIIYVAVNNDLQKSTDKGVSFSSMTSFSSNITSIEVNNENNSIVYVTTRGTAGKVFKSIDGGTNFTDITGNLPSIPKKIIKTTHLVSTALDFLDNQTASGVRVHDNNNFFGSIDGCEFLHQTTS